MTTLPSPTGRPRHRIAVGDTLPSLSFPLAGTGGRLAWSQGRTAPVIFVPHLGPCAECVQYAEALAAGRDALAEWAARALVLLSTNLVGEVGAWQRPGLSLLADDDGAGRAQLGVGNDQAAVVQADRWGAVYDTAVIRDTGDHGHLPSVSALVALAKYIDIQCPECGVPSKEWMLATPFPLG